MSLEAPHLHLLLRMSLEVGPADPFLPLALSTAVDGWRDGGERFRAECDRLLDAAPHKCDYVARCLARTAHSTHSVHSTPPHARLIEALVAQDPAAALMVAPDNAHLVWPVISAPDPTRGDLERDAAALSVRVLARLHQLTGRLEFVVHAVLLWTGVDGLASYLTPPPDKNMNE